MLAHQLTAQDLADCGLRQLIAEFHVSWHLELSKPLLAPFLDILLANALARLKHHPRFDCLTAIGIGDTGNADLQYLGVLRDHFLNLTRPYLETAGFDQLLLAIHNVEETFLIHPGDITGI